MSHILVSSNDFCVLTLYKNTQTCLPEPDHGTVKYFTESVEFKRFLKFILPHILLS